MLNHILHSDKISSLHSGLGGKAEGLLFLKRHIFNVPPFYLLNESAIQSIIKDNAIAKESVIEWIRENHIPADSLWAVRSSAGVEDGSTQSYAGLFKTITNVKTPKIAEAILQVIDGFQKISQLSYAKTENKSFSVIIQEMVHPDYAGVLFSRNPLNPDSETMILNIIPGLGENLVSGKESALKGEYSKADINWTNRGDTFNGQIYSDGLKAITKTGEQIIADIQPFLPELFKGAEKMSDLKKHPVDIEFAIASGKIYWLQLRPITALEKNRGTLIYDNSNIGESYPGISLPLTISFVQYTYDFAYSAMAKYIGMGRLKILMNKHLLKNMVGGIYGALYYNITAWQQLLYQLPFGDKTSKQITRLLGMEPAAFDIPAGGKPSFFSYIRLFGKTILAFLLLKKQKKSYLENCESALKDYKAEKYTSMTHMELIALYHQINTRLTTNWLAPVLNGFYAMILLMVLRKMIKNSRIDALYPNFVNDILFSQGDIISVRIVRDFQKLILSIQSDDQLKSLFISGEPEEILQQLPIKYPVFHKEMNSYLTQFGERCDQGELKMETLNYKEDPVRFIDLLKTNTNSQYNKQNPPEIFNHRSIILQNYRYRPLRKYLLLFLIRNALHRIRDRENYRFIRTRVFALIRILFRAMDHSLYKDKWIQHPGDSLYLELSEILDTKRLQEYIKIIAIRKKDYTLYEKIEHAFRYCVRGESITPVDIGSHVRSDEAIKGIGCCSGTVVNTVKIIHAETMQQNDFSGQILVAAYFEPGWINLFSQAAGVISEKGNLLSHTAILCREMGIPTIVGAKGIASALKDGDLIQMDGATGEIRIIEHGK